MNVYFCGSEDIEFALTGAATGGNSGVDTSWVAGSVDTSTGTTVWPPSNNAANPTSFGNLSNFWVHASAQQKSNSTTVSGTIFLGLADSSGIGRILIRGTGTAGQYKISSRNAAGTITDFSGAVTAAGAYTFNANTKYDLFVNYSVSGQVQLYINGVLAADTGAGVNVTTDSATSLSYLYLGSVNTQGAAWSNLWSQVIVADSDTRGAGLWKMNSTTAGNAQTWAGTASNVNKAIATDGTYISAASAGLIEEYQTGGIAIPAGTFAVAAVKLSSRASVGGSGPQHLEYVTRVGSTDYVGGSWGPIVGSFVNDTQNYLQATNPGTSTAWTTADLTASTFNYGVESVA